VETRAAVLASHAGPVLIADWGRFAALEGDTAHIPGNGRRSGPAAKEPAD